MSQLMSRSAIKISFLISAPVHMKGPIVESAFPFSMGFLLFEAKANVKSWKRLFWSPKRFHKRWNSEKLLCSQLLQCFDSVLIFDVCFSSLFLGKNFKGYKSWFSIENVGLSIFTTKILWMDAEEISVNYASSWLLNFMTTNILHGNINATN